MHTRSVTLESIIQEFVILGVEGRNLPIGDD